MEKTQQLESWLGVSLNSLLYNCVIKLGVFKKRSCSENQPLYFEEPISSGQYVHCKPRSPDRPKCQGVLKLGPEVKHQIFPANPGTIGVFTHLLFWIWYSPRKLTGQWKIHQVMKFEDVFPISKMVDFPIFKWTLGMRPAVLQTANCRSRDSRKKATRRCAAGWWDEGHVTFWQGYTRWAMKKELVVYRLYGGLYCPFFWGL